MLTVDSNTLMQMIKEKYGEEVHDSRLPSQSYFEAFQEKLAEGNLYLETLAQVVGLVEEQRQKQSKPDGSRQMWVQSRQSLYFIDEAQVLVEDARYHRGLM